MARAVSYSVSAWRESSSEATPFSKRRRVRRSDSSRVLSVSCVIASNSSSATSASQVLATAATSVICAALRPSSLPTYCAKAASLRLRTRPNRSSSHAETARPAVYRLELVVEVAGWCV